MADDTPRVRMRESRDGSPNGTHIYRYEAGALYDAHTTPRMSAMLAAIFLREGWADIVTADDAPEPEPEPEPASTRRRAGKIGPGELKEESADAK